MGLYGKGQNRLVDNGVSSIFSDNNDVFPSNFTSPTGAEAWAFGGKEASAFPGLDLPVEQRPLNKYLDVYSSDDMSALEVFHCPSDRDTSAEFEIVGNSYTTNANIFGSRLSGISAPSSNLELASDERGPLFYHGGGKDDVNMTITYYVNVVFLDGHVRFCVHPDDYDETQDGVLESGKKVCLFPVLY